WRPDSPAGAPGPHGGPPAPPDRTGRTVAGCPAEEWTPSRWTPRCGVAGAFGTAGSSDRSPAGGPGSPAAPDRRRTARPPASAAGGCGSGPAGSPPDWTPAWPGTG